MGVCVSMEIFLGVAVYSLSFLSGGRERYPRLQQVLSLGISPYPLSPIPFSFSFSFSFLVLSLFLSFFLSFFLFLSFLFLSLSVSLKKK